MLCSCLLGSAQLAKRIIPIFLSLLYTRYLQVGAAGGVVVEVEDVVAGEEEKSLLWSSPSWEMTATSTTAMFAGMWAMSYVVMDARMFIILPVFLGV